MNKYSNELTQILRSKMGVSSGVYSVINPEIKTQLNEYGEYEYVLDERQPESQYESLLKVDMMSSLSPDEDAVGQELYGDVKDIKHDPEIGYFLDLYAGYVLEGDFRKNGSSGGVTSWIIAELFKRKEIDGVIHAHAIDPTQNNGKLFKYVISRTMKDIKQGARSRYYPMELSETLQTVKNEPGRYAVVGIPEFIMELRLLAKEDPVIKKSIKYTLGLVCGHQKSAKYAEALAWQHGIKPGDLREIDFRVKQPKSTAIDYLHKFTGLIDGKLVTFTKTHSELFAENWGAGFFKTKFSDFTDNTFNEVADVVLGDAWLPEYNKDGMGNNIVIVRDPKIAKIIKEGLSNRKLKLDIVEPDTIKASQRGLIHHTRDELPYRLYKHAKSSSWKLKKRVKPSNKLPAIRKKIQDTRYKIARESHVVFKEAVKQGRWDYFEKETSPLLEEYKNLYSLRDHKDLSLTAKIRGVAQPRTRIKKGLKRVKDATRVRTRLKNTIRPNDDWHNHKKFSKPDGAIITLTGHYNYGNIIQRYALQEFLRKKKLYFVSLLRDHGGRDNLHYERTESTRAFVSDRIIAREFQAEDSYPVYIVGSDQVWRSWSYDDISEELGYYFLNFLDDKSFARRIAYAASFGLEDIEAALGPRDLTESFSTYVHKFDAISVREDSAATIMKETWGISPPVVVDPTMLLSKRDYSLLIDRSPRKLHPTNAVFGYILANTKQKRIIIDKVIGSIKKDAWVMYLKEDEALYPVEQWLKGFRDAEFVVTDSFHGTVFAILNNTPFVVVENQFGGVSRLNSLLGRLGLEDRLVAEADADTFDPSALEPINWRTVNRALNSLRKDSERWLIDAVSVRK